MQKVERKNQSEESSEGEDSEEESSEEDKKGKESSDEGSNEEKKETVPKKIKKSKAPLITETKKRSLKRREKELRKLRKQANKEITEILEEAGKDLPNTEEKENAKDIKPKTSNNLEMKFTSASQTINKKPPVKKTPGRTGKRQKTEDNSFDPQKSYKNQFNCLPKSKMSPKLQESIISDHLKQTQPSKKSLQKANKLTPDFYLKAKAPNSKHPMTQQPEQTRRNSPHKKSKRRNSHGNRTFTRTDKLTAQRKDFLCQESLKNHNILLCFNHFDQQIK